MTREELFAKALADRKKSKEAEASKKSASGFSYQDTTWTSLEGTESSLDKIIRIVGHFPNNREKSTDAKALWFSKIKGDSGKTIHCIWPSKDEKPDWILYRVLERVLEYKWNKEKQTRDYIYQDKFPAIFKRVMKNGDEHKFAQGWKPKQIMLVNVLDRADMAWHKEHKKTKVLSKSAFEVKDGLGYEFGVPNYLYETIFDDVVEYYGHWEQYDIALRRSKDKPYYHAFHGEGDLIKISGNSKAHIVKGDLSEEEKGWERQDLDAISKVAGYQKLKKHLLVFLKSVDEAFYSNFAEELSDLAADEKKDYEKKKAEAAAANAPQQDEPDTDSAPPADVPPAAPASRRAAPEAPAPEAPASAADELGEIIDFDGLTSGSYNGTKYLGIEKLSDSEKSKIHAVNDDGSFTYLVDGKLLRTTADGLLPEEKSKFLSPECFATCPKTGLTFV